MQFLSLSRQAQAYYEGLEQRRVNPRHHLRKIVALSEIYGVEAVDRAIEDGSPSTPSAASTSPIPGDAGARDVPHQVLCI